jgi:protein TonB
METNHTSIENFNDMVFENRNKAYGAYAIRNAYNDHVSLALFIALLLSGTLALFTFLFNKSEDKIPKFDDPYIISDPGILVELRPALPEPKVLEKPKLPEEHALKSDNLNLVASDKKEDAIETTNKDAVITSKGKVDGTDSASKELVEPTIITKVEPSSNETKIVADQMPEFSGNLFQYLQNKIQYPYAARDMGTSGTVVLQFIVEKDGAINDIKVLKSVADGCTEEAIRVVKSMPRWKPGKNHGEPVRVLFNLPVKFTIK